MFNSNYHTNHPLKLIPKKNTKLLQLNDFQNNWPQLVNQLLTKFPLLLTIFNNSEVIEGIMINDKLTLTIKLSNQYPKFENLIKGIMESKLSSFLNIPTVITFSKVPPIIVWSPVDLFIIKTFNSNHKNLTWPNLKKHCLTVIDYQSTKIIKPYQLNILKDIKNLLLVINQVQFLDDYYLITFQKGYSFEKANEIVSFYQSHLLTLFNLLWHINCQKIIINQLKNKVIEKPAIVNNNYYDYMFPMNILKYWSLDSNSLEDLKIKLLSNLKSEYYGNLINHLTIKESSNHYLISDEMVKDRKLRFFLDLALFSLNNDKEVIFYDYQLPQELNTPINLTKFISNLIGVTNLNVTVIKRYLVVELDVSTAKIKLLNDDLSIQDKVNQYFDTNYWLIFTAPNYASFWHNLTYPLSYYYKLLTLTSLKIWLRTSSLVNTNNKIILYIPLKLKNKIEYIESLVNKTFNRYSLSLNLECQTLLISACNNPDKHFLKNIHES